MNKLKSLVIVSTVVFASIVPMAMAQTNVGVLDVDAALKGSNAAQAYNKASKKRFGSRLNKLKKMELDSRKMADKLKKDGPTMSKLERSKLEISYKQKADEFQLEASQFQKDKAEADQKELEKLGPILKKAVTGLAKDKGYDVIIERGATVFTSENSDVTKQVIDRINKATH